MRQQKPRNAPYKVSDGEGLHLLVQPNGARLWRLAYRFGGRQKLLALGAYPKVGLAGARQARDDAKLQLANGADPGEVRKAAKRRSSQPAGNAFEAVARRWYRAREAGWVRSHADRIWNRIEQDILPLFGPKHIATIESSDLLDALRRIEDRGAIETARRVRTYVRDIFEFAIGENLVQANPADRIGRALKARPPTKHRNALKAKELPGFLRQLGQYDGDLLTKCALRFALLTFARTSEIRFARWNEFEHLGTDAALWRIPAERMKVKNGRPEHLVPLAPQSQALLEDMRAAFGGQGFVFPGRSSGGVMSENTMLFAIYRLGFHSRATVHGFRRTASTILNEHGFNRDWIERQLAHLDQDEVRAAYNAAEWLPERRSMMVWWADYLDRRLAECDQATTVAE